MRVFGLLLVSLLISFALADKTNFADLTRADRIVVHKEKRLMELYAEDRVIRSYKIALGDSPVGHKSEEGDERTPEGHYMLDWRNAKSGYHLSIHMSYPSDRDTALAKARGVEPGGMIMIHGQPNYLPAAMGIPSSMDWTDGCIAVTNAEMDEIWNLVADNTPIEIKP